MLDGTHFYECQCHSDEHTLKFVLDKEDKELYTAIFLNQWRPWWKRAWIAVRYAFGYKCKYGHWDNWTMQEEDAKRLRCMLDELLGD